MPDGPYMTPEEDAVMRMIGRSGSPQAAAANLLERLEALEAAAAALEAQIQEEKIADCGMRIAELEPQPDDEP